MRWGFEATGVVAIRGVEASAAEGRLGGASRGRVSQNRAKPAGRAGREGPSRGGGQGVYSRVWDNISIGSEDHPGFDS